MNTFTDFFHNLFTPHEGNGYRAKALHSSFLTGYLVLALLLTATFQYVGNNFSNVLGYATDINVNKLLTLTNEERTKNNLSMLTYNEKLSQAAQKKAEDMFKKNYWSHYAPDGAAPWDFIVSSGYSYEYAGENLAKNFLFSQGVVDAWMKSESHRENIMRKEYTEVGYAVMNGVLNGEQTTLVVQMFGTPGKSTTQTTTRKPETRVANAAESSKSVLSLHAVQPSFNITKTVLGMNIVFVVFLLVALIVDFYVATKLQIVRMHGKNIAHVMFVVFMLIGLVLLTKGAIL